MSIVGTVCASASNYRAKLVCTGVLHGYYTSPHTCNSRANSCSFQHWHTCCTPAKLVPTLAATTSHHKMQPMQNPCQLWARLVLARMLLHAKAVPNVGRGAVLTCVYNCSSHWHTKKVKIRNNYSCFNNCKSLISLVVATTATTMEK